MVIRSLILTVALVCVAGTAIPVGTASDDDVAINCFCPKGYVVRYERDGVGGYICLCYKFVRDIASWAEAKVYCDVMHTTMVEVRDDATHDWLEHYLHSLESDFNHHLLEKPEYWLAATDLEVEDRWRWDPSNAVATYTSWLPNEPDNFLGYQNCLAVRRRCWDMWDMHCLEYGWFDDDCYQKKFYICERPGNSFATANPIDDRE